MFWQVSIDEWFDVTITVGIFLFTKSSKRTPTKKIVLFGKVYSEVYYFEQKMVLINAEG